MKIQPVALAVGLIVSVGCSTGSTTNHVDSAANKDTGQSDTAVGDRDTGTNRDASGASGDTPVAADVVSGRDASDGPDDRRAEDDAASSGDASTEPGGALDVGNTASNDAKDAAPTTEAGKPDQQVDTDLNSGALDANAADTPTRDVADAFSKTESGAQPQTALVRLSPLDGETNVVTKDITFTFEQRGAQGIPAQAIAAAVILTTFPEGLAVPADVVVTGGDAGTSALPTIVVKPKSPLGDRWYLVGVTQLPSEVEWAPSYRMYRGSDGTTGSRFRAGSQPHVWMIELCPKAGSSTKARVMFSELIGTGGAGASPASLFYLGDATPIPDCTLGPATAGEIDFICSSLDSTRPLHLVVSDGLTSADGSEKVVPQVLDPGPLATMPMVPTGCQGYAPPPEVPGAGACLPGATELDCIRCGTPADLGTCPRACPRVDCLTSPDAPECGAVCADHACCSCGSQAGADQWLAGQLTCPNPG